jgi:hypothetical protein
MLQAPVCPPLEDDANNVGLVVLDDEDAFNIMNHCHPRRHLVSVNNTQRRNGQAEWSDTNEVDLIASDLA